MFLHPSVFEYSAEEHRIQRTGFDHTVWSADHLCVHELFGRPFELYVPFRSISRASTNQLHSPPVTLELFLKFATAAPTVDKGRERGESVVDSWRPQRGDSQQRIEKQKAGEGKEVRTKFQTHHSHPTPSEKRTASNKEGPRSIGCLVPRHHLFLNDIRCCM